MIRRYVLTLDLKNDPHLIAEYCRYHQNVWPEIHASLKSSGIKDAEIYLLGTRLFMILEVGEDFSWEKKIKADQENPIVQEWETLMSTFQQPLPQAKPGEKWLLMERIFKLPCVEPHVGPKRFRSHAGSSQRENKNPSKSASVIAFASVAIVESREHAMFIV